MCSKHPPAPPYTHTHTQQLGARRRVPPQRPQELRQTQRTVKPTRVQEGASWEEAGVASPAPHHGYHVHSSLESLEQLLGVLCLRKYPRAESLTNLKTSVRRSTSQSTQTYAQIDKPVKTDIAIIIWPFVLPIITLLVNLVESIGTE